MRVSNAKEFFSHTLLKSSIAAALLSYTLLISPATQADTFYKWKDSSGVWSYGEHPPQGVNAIAITTSSGRASTPKNDSAADNSEAEDNAGGQSSEGTEYFVTETAKVSKKEKARLCTAAKANLETLQSAAVIRKRDANGEVTVISDEERQTEIDNAKQTIKDFC